MRIDLFQNIINIYRGKFLYLRSIIEQYLHIEKLSELETLVLGSSHATFYQANANEFNLATPSQDLYYSYNLYNKYGKNCKNIILTYSVFSKGLCLIKTKEIELCILMKIIFGIDYQFKDFAKRKNCYFLEPFYKIRIKNSLKNPNSLRKRVIKENELQSMTDENNIQIRAKKHYKNFLRETTQLEYLEKLLYETKENNQNLILVIPPATKIYKEALPDGNDIFKHLFELCEKYDHVKILDYYSTEEFSRQEFVDGDHLNEVGNVKLTEFVRGSI